MQTWLDIGTAPKDGAPFLGWDFLNSEVSHWMPLPAPPKEADNV